MTALKKSRILALVCLIFFVLSFSKGASAADIILDDLKGKAVNLSACKGKPMILFFWTTSCPYCRKEIKTLNQLYLQMKKEGINLFAVNVGDSNYAVQKFSKSYAIGFRVLLDRDGSLADRYNVMGVPTYILIDKSGRIDLEYSLPVDYKKFLLGG